MILGYRLSGYEAVTDVLMYCIFIQYFEILKLERDIVKLLLQLKPSCLLPSAV